MSLSGQQELRCFVVKRHDDLLPNNEEGFVNRLSRCMLIACIACAARTAIDKAWRSFSLSAPRANIVEELSQTAESLSPPLASQLPLVVFSSRESAGQKLDGSEEQSCRKENVLARDPSYRDNGIHLPRLPRYQYAPSLSHTPHKFQLASPETSIPSLIQKDQVYGHPH